MAHFRLTFLALLLAGCGGDEPIGTGPGPGPGPGNTVVDLCAEPLPVYNLDGASCDAITNAFEDTLADASDCVVDADCVQFSGRCDVNLTGSCHAIANRCLTQADIDAFADAYSRCDDDPRSACPTDCGTPIFGCVEGTCVLDRLE